MLSKYFENVLNYVVIDIIIIFFGVGGGKMCIYYCPLINIKSNPSPLSNFICRKSMNRKIGKNAHTNVINYTVCLKFSEQRTRKFSTK